MLLLEVAPQRQLPLSLCSRCLFFHKPEALAKVLRVFVASSACSHERGAGGEGENTERERGATQPAGSASARFLCTSPEKTKNRALALLAGGGRENTKRNTALRTGARSAAKRTKNFAATASTLAEAEDFLVVGSGRPKP
jgi:hypothetical protein